MFLLSFHLFEKTKLHANVSLVCLCVDLHRNCVSFSLVLCRWDVCKEQGNLSIVPSLCFVVCA